MKYLKLYEIFEEEDFDFEESQVDVKYIDKKDISYSSDHAWHSHVHIKGIGGDGWFYYNTKSSSYTCGGLKSKTKIDLINKIEREKRVKFTDKAKNYIRWAVEY